MFNNIIIVWGLSFSYPTGGFGTNLSSLIIQPGTIAFNSEIKQQYGNWLTLAKYKLSTNYVIKLPANGLNAPQLISIYAFPDNLTNISQNLFPISIQLSVGNNNLNPPMPDDLPNGIYLGTIFLPANFPNGGQRSYFRSLNNSINETNFAVSISDYLEKKLKEVEEWQPYTLYYENQIIRFDNTQWFANLTHASTNDFTSDSNLYWTEIGGGGELDCIGINDCLFYDETIVEFGKQYVLTYMRVPNQNPVVITSKKIS